jgi:serine/threonine protein kinase
VVLYEMLTGKRPFDGEDVSDTLAAVLRAEPDWTALPANAPPTVRTLLQGCLVKERARRIGDIAVAKFVLGDSNVTDAPHRLASESTGVSAKSRSRWALESRERIQGPAFSPDGESIVFYSSVDKTLKRIALGGGTAMTISPDLPSAPLGVRWGPDGIVFGQNRLAGPGILRVSETGGTRARLVTLNDDEVADSPQVLSSGEAVLFTLLKDKGPRRDDRWDRANIVVQSLRTGGRTVCFANT